MVYIILAAIIWIGVYATLKLSSQPIEVKPIRSINDLFE